MKRWLLWAGALGLFVIVAPFALLVVAPRRAASLMLVAHYQGLVLAVITLAVAILAFITFVGLDNRIEGHMQRLSEQLRNENKAKLRLLWDLEYAQANPSDFEAVVAAIAQDRETYAFFRDDLQRVFLQFKAPGQITPATAEHLHRSLTEYDSDRHNASWRFWVNLARQSIDGWQYALKYANALEDTEWLRMQDWLPWIWSQWNPNNPGEWNTAVGNLVDGLQRRFQLHDKASQEMEQLCRGKFPGTNPMMWSTPSFATPVRWYLRQTGGTLVVWEARYGDLQGMTTDYDNSTENRTNFLDFVRKDFRKRDGERYDHLTTVADMVKVVVLYPYDLMTKAIQEHHELPYGVMLIARQLFVSAGSPIPPETAWAAFLSRMEQEQKVELLWVADKPRAPPPLSSHHRINPLKGPLTSE